MSYSRTSTAVALAVLASLLFTQSAFCCPTVTGHVGIAHEAPDAPGTGCGSTHDDHVGHDTLGMATRGCGEGARPVGPLMPSLVAGVAAGSGAWTEAALPGPPHQRCSAAGRTLLIDLCVARA